VERLVRQTCELDHGRGFAHVCVRMEQEPGSSGVNTIDHYARDVLSGFDFRGDRVTGSKEDRARPLSSAAEAGNVKILAGPWVNAFLDEAEAFPESKFKDQVDAVSGAFGVMATATGPIDAFKLI
jgi:predicted phage terminase large subunit-like protein